MTALMITFPGLSQSRKFERAENVIWVPTKHFVDSGLEYYDIEYKVLEPCLIISDLIDTKKESARFKD